MVYELYAKRWDGDALERESDALMAPFRRDRKTLETVALDSPNRRPMSRVDQRACPGGGGDSARNTTRSIFSRGTA
jgi:hypothetical protein